MFSFTPAVFNEIKHYKHLLKKKIFITDMGSLNSHAPVNPAGLVLLTALGDLKVSHLWVNKLTSGRQLFFPMLKENLKQENGSLISECY